MQLATRSDAELVRLAQQGVPTAFAALVHRHAPVVRATVATADDPQAAVVDTFVLAMRRLRDLDPDEPIGPWLQTLAHRQGSDPAPVAPDRAPAMDVDELDRVWLELARRWPKGRRPRRLPRWLVRGVSAIALIAAVLAVAVLGPYVVLTTAVDRGPTAVVVAEVTAEPYAGELEREAEVADDEPADDGPADDGPADDDPFGDEPGDDEPGDDDPFDDEPGDGGGA